MMSLQQHWFQSQPRLLEQKKMQRLWSEVQLAWLIEDADQGDANAVTMLLKSISECLAHGGLPSPEVVAWYMQCVNALPTEPSKNSDKRARQIASAFSFGKKKGKPRREDYKKFCVVREVYRLHRLDKISMNEAMSEFVNQNPDFSKSIGSTEYLRQLCEEYLPLVKQSHADWIENILP